MPDEPPLKPKFVLKSKDVAYTDSPETDAATPAFDIAATLQANYRRQVASEPPPDFTPRRSRRRRDYWLCLVPLNLGLGTLAVLGRDNPVILVYSVAGIVLVTVSLTWVMWFVMSDY
jgi:hypothetical protein